jgi:hypothetical protein
MINEQEIESIPRLKLALTKTSQLIERICIVSLIVLWIFQIIIFIQSPNIVPIHFNNEGLPDGYGSKYINLFLPLIATFIYFLLTMLAKYPHLHNYMVQINSKNALEQYTNSVNLIRHIKLSVLILFIIIEICIFLTIKGVVKGIGKYFIVVVVFSMLIPILIAIKISIQKK